MLISRHAVDPNKALVTVTPSGKYQYRVAFNASLARPIVWGGDFIAIDWDEAKSRLTFITNVGKSYGGGWTFPLTYDAGVSTGTGRTLWLSKKRFSFLKPGKYEPVLDEVIGGDDEPGLEEMHHLTISISL